VGRPEREQAEAAGVEPASTAFPTACYLCSGHDLALRYPARPLPTDAPSYNCTSLGHGHHAPIWACRRCGLLFQWPMPSSDALLTAYQDVVDPLYVTERDNRYLTFRRVARALGPAHGRRLLDVGAYCGYFVDVAREAGFRAEGAELSLWAVEEARRLGVTMHNQTVSERAASGDRYDVVTMWDVVEHLGDPRAELRAACRLLEPGGQLHLATIDAGSRAARILGRRWPWLMDMHLYYFDRATIAELLTQAGFHVERVSTYTHVVSAGYLMQKAGAAVAPARQVAGVLRRALPKGWRVPVNLGDNIHVVATRSR
jgi:2-polyprenyl-3-methyl-5-hydroxy-6-metoxy-1,4-benzoquinol methylase